MKNFTINKTLVFQPVSTLRMPKIYKENFDEVKVLDFIEEWLTENNIDYANLKVNGESFTYELDADYKLTIKEDEDNYYLILNKASAAYALVTE